MFRVLVLLAVFGFVLSVPVKEPKKEKEVKKPDVIEDQLKQLQDKGSESNVEVKKLSPSHATIEKNKDSQNKEADRNHTIKAASAEVISKAAKDSTAKEQKEDAKNVLEIIDDAKLKMEFTPKAVAEYLLISGDIESFFKALAELVKVKVMTIEEAKKYEIKVQKEYRKLLDSMAQTDFYYYDSNTDKKASTGAPSEITENPYDLKAIIEKISLDNSLDREFAEQKLRPLLKNTVQMTDEDIDKVTSILTGNTKNVLVTESPKLKQKEAKPTIQKETTQKGSKKSVKM